MTRLALLALALASPLAARADASYGAIAYGAQSTAYGYSSDQPSQQAAERVALNDCRSNGDDCRIVASFANGCGAVAAIESKAVFSTGRGSTEEEAQRDALNTCERTHGKGCELEVWSCAN